MNAGSKSTAETQFDSPTMACNHGCMPERNLQIARFIGATPSTAYCDVCKLMFRTRQEFLVDAEKAKEQLQSDFERHECKPDPNAVNDALEHIR
ncbi:MAG TPA: hypothetical protein VKY85_15110 [Candidatus Angelobacter sp.]|nr:hypothetical protein [Candidatus Angelobacter sp.]